MAVPQWAEISYSYAQMRHDAHMLPRSWDGKTKISPTMLDDLFKALITMADALDRRDSR